MKIPSISTVAMMIMITLINARYCRANFSPEMMISSESPVTIAHANLELELLMDSDISRMLGAASLNIADKVKNPKKPALGCGPANHYCTADGKAKDPRCSDPYYRARLKYC